MAPEDDWALRPSGLGAIEPGDVRAEVAIRVTPINRGIWIVATILIVATFAAQIVHEVVGLNTVVTLFDADVKQNFPTAAKILLLLGSTILFVKGSLYDGDDWQLLFALAAAVSDSLELIGLAVLVTSLLVALARDTAHFDLSLRE